jgi:hypothetical protein
LGRHLGQAAQVFGESVLQLPVGSDAQQSRIGTLVRVGQPWQ